METPKIRTFTDLLAWREGHKLVLLVYRMTKDMPQREWFSLIDQMRRAVVSITSNIAEGFGRQTLKEKTQFYYMAQGSLIELKNQILISQDLKYLSQEQFDEIANQANHAHRLLQGLITATKKKMRATS